MGLGCLAIMSILMSRNFKAAIIVGIATTTIISWIPGHAASYLGAGSNIMGERGFHRCNIVAALQKAILVQE